MAIVEDLRAGDCEQTTRATTEPVTTKFAWGNDDPTRRYAARILVVDDDMGAAETVRALRKQGYSNVELYRDSRRGAEALKQAMPDLVMVRWRMPSPDGHAILSQLLLDYADEVMVIALMEPGDRKGRLKALSCGARATIDHPVDGVELVMRVRNLLDTRFMRRELRQLRMVLSKLKPSVREGLLRARSEERVLPGEPQLERVAKLWRVLDPARAKMGEQVAELSGALGERLGMADEEVRQLRAAATIYDFGMLAVSPELRNSEEKLEAEAIDALRRHVEMARSIFDGAEFSGAEIVRQVISLHHERWDGRGYPGKLRGESIPLAAQIVGVSQFFVALLEERPYRAALSLEDALAEAVREKGFALSPRVVEALEALHGRPQETPIPGYDHA
jgi:putative two-component system response regulator